MNTKAALAYIRAIRNDAKRRYAYDWLDYCLGAANKPVHTSESYSGLSYMAAQAVRIALEELGFSLDRPGS